MTQDEIIRMAREAGLLVFQSSFCGTSFDFTLEQLERFYQLAFAAGAAHEREACALMVDKLYHGSYMRSIRDCAAAIRARSQIRGEK